MTYPKLVSIAWDIVEQLGRDWQRDPLRYWTEKDVQTDLATRLRSAYDLIGRGSLRGVYEEYRDVLGANQRWSRVSCEPSVYFAEAGEAACRPDIVVWDDIDDPEDPPDAASRANWPILWACEIKYVLCQRLGRKLISPAEVRKWQVDQETRGEWDVQKLQRLADDGTLRYGCALIICLSHSDESDESGESKEGIHWDYSPGPGSEDRRVHTCTVQLPRDVDLRGVQKGS